MKQFNYDLLENKKNKPKKLTTTCKLPKPFSLKEIKKILK